METKNLAQVSDEGYLEEVVAQILNDNPKEVASYLAGKETVFQWMMGQVARLTKGKADPQVARQLLTTGSRKSQKNIIFLYKCNDEYKVIAFLCSLCLVFSVRYNKRHQKEGVKSCPLTSA